MIPVRAMRLGALALVCAALAPGGREAGAGAADGSAACCFENARYSGVCTVVPAEGETCASILAYLNNPNSQGKTYCGSTSVRGGWRQVKCE